jgi:hypothetical protein
VNLHRGQNALSGPTLAISSGEESLSMAAM